MNARYRKQMRLRSRHHRSQPCPQPAIRHIIHWAPEPCGNAWPMTEPVASDLELRGQLLVEQRTKPVTIIKVGGELL